MNAAKDCTLQEKLLRCAMALILAAGALLASVAASPAYAAPSTVDVSIGGKNGEISNDDLLSRRALVPDARAGLLLDEPRAERRRDSDDLVLVRLSRLRRVDVPE